MSFRFCPSGCRLLERLSRFSGSIRPAARVIDLRSRRTWRQVGERFGVGTLRASGPVELREGRIVSEKRLQTRRLRREQLDLGVEDIQLHPCASVEPGFGQAQRFLSQSHVFLLALNKFAVLLQI